MDGFICLPFCFFRGSWINGFICLPLSTQLGCLARGPLCLPSFVSCSWMFGTAFRADRFICCLLAFVFHCLPSLDSWHGCVGGRIHLSPFVSLHLSRVVSLGGRVHLSPFIFCGWLSCAALWVDSFICLPLSSSLFVSLCLPSFVSSSLDAWRPLSPFLSPIVSQLGCLVRLSGGTGSFVSLCFFCCWMPGTALWVDGFISPLFSTRLSLGLDAWLRNACLNARVRLIKPQAACCGCTHECFK